jgi:hypothetical protein
MTRRAQSELAARWAAQMYVLLAATGRPWAVDDLLDAVCGRCVLTPFEQEAVAQALARLWATPGVAHGEDPPGADGRAA